MCARNTGATAADGNGATGNGEDWARLVAAIQSGRPAPLYLLTGEEYTRRQAIDTLLEMLLPSSARDFNLDLLDGARLEGHHLAVLCREYPLMHDHRVILVRDAERLSATAWEELENYFATPSETTVLIFSAAKLDKRRVFYKRIKAAGEVIEFKPPAPEQMPGWIQTWLEQHGRKISWEQAQTLADQIEPRLNLVVREIEKLLTISLDAAEISDAHIEQCIGVSREFSVFELTNAFFRRDLERTVTIYNHTARTIAPQQLLAALSNSLTRLWSVARLRGNGRNHRDIAAALGLNPWAVKYDLERLAHFTQAEIEEAVSWLTEADEQLKTTATDPRNVFIRFLTRIAGQRS